MRIPHRVARWVAFGLLILLALALAFAPRVLAQYDGLLAVVSPALGETVHDNDGQVRVTVVASGPAGELPAAFRPLLDGSRHGPDRRSPTFVLEGVERGEHVLQVQWIAADGSVARTSPPVTFHLWRASALFPSRVAPH